MRLRVIYAKGLRESWKSQSRAGRHGPATVVRVSSRRHVLSVGTDDDWQLYEIIDSPGRFYCVGINRRHEYVGVQAYDPEDQEPREELSMFLQGEQVDLDLGQDALDRLMDRTIARRLIERLETCLCG